MKAETRCYFLLIIFYVINFCQTIKLYIYIKFLITQLNKGIQLKWLQFVVHIFH